MSATAGHAGGPVSAFMMFSYSLVSDPAKLFIFRWIVHTNFGVWVVVWERHRCIETSVSAMSVRFRESGNG